MHTKHGNALLKSLLPVLRNLCACTQAQRATRHTATTPLHAMPLCMWSLAFTQEAAAVALAATSAVHYTSKHTSMAEVPAYHYTKDIDPDISLHYELASGLLAAVQHKDMLAVTTAACMPIPLSHALTQAHTIHATAAEAATATLQIFSMQEAPHQQAIRPGNH